MWRFFYSSNKRVPYMYKTMPLKMLEQKSGCPVKSMLPSATATKTITTERIEDEVKVKEQTVMDDTHAIKQRSRHQVPSGGRAYDAYVIAA